MSVSSRLDELERRVAALEARLPPKYEGPIWICGHRHPTREDAVKCCVYQAQQERMPS